MNPKLGRFDQLFGVIPSLGIPTSAVPITHYHVGPGLLLKAIRPQSLSIAAFIMANIVIDTEVIINFVLGRRPLHAVLHTYWAATVIGLLSGVTVTGVRRLSDQNRESWAVRPALLGGVLGGLSQPLLDSVMHADLQPFWPMSEANPMLHAIGVQTLHLGCTVAGLIGGIVLIIRWWRAGETSQLH